MAELQGYFLQHKDDPAAAVSNVLQIKASIVPKTHEDQADRSRDRDEDKDPSSDEATGVDRPTPPPPLRRPPRRSRRVTALELDKMPFNPQYDWEKDIYTGPK